MSKMPVQQAETFIGGTWRCITTGHTKWHFERVGREWEILIVFKETEIRQGYKIVDINPYPYLFLKTQKDGDYKIKSISPTDMELQLDGGMVLTFYRPDQSIGM